MLISKSNIYIVSVNRFILCYKIMLVAGGARVSVWYKAIMVQTWTVYYIAILVKGDSVSIDSMLV